MWSLRITIILILYNIFFSGEELTSAINESESIVTNCLDKKEKVDSEIYMSLNAQEHKKYQNFKKRKGLLKATCNQGLYSSLCKNFVKANNQVFLKEFLNFEVAVFFKITHCYKIISPVFVKPLLENLLDFRYVLVIFLCLLC